MTMNNLQVSIAAIQTRYGLTGADAIDLHVLSSAQRFGQLPTWNLDADVDQDEVERSFQRLATAGQIYWQHSKLQIFDKEPRNPVTGRLVVKNTYICKESGRI